ncbi:MAG: GNAT family N-acetyltransferase [Terriglobales bacterium]
MENLRLLVLDEIPEDAEFRQSWNELAQLTEQPQVFYTCEWAIAVQYAYAGSLKPLIFLAYDGDSLTGAVALARESESEAVVFLTGTTADYCDFLSEAGKRREFIGAVFHELRDRQVEKIVLANLPADSSSAPAISAAASISGYHLLSRPAYFCARVVLGSGEQRAALKQSTLAKKMLRRNLRDMEKLAAVGVRHDTCWEEIEPALQSFQRAHVARFLVTGRISNMVRPERRDFLRELARRLSPRGWVTLSRLFLGDVAVAWNYGFQFSGSWFWYQPTLDSRYDSFSPGFCLLSKIVETACDRPDLEVIDLGLGAEGYKERFATSTRETSHLTLNRSLRRHVEAAGRQRLAAAATASPWVENRIRSLISHGGRWRNRLGKSGFPGLIGWSCRRLWKSLFATSEVLFFEWAPSGGRSANGTLTLEALDFDLTAAAAMRHADEPSTLDYLMRCAQRLRSSDARGFALVTGDGHPVHFCWAKDFDGFRMDELERTLQAPRPNAALVFDCFTPPSSRGNGYFAMAISLLAGQLHASGQVPWIFAAATNHDSVHGIEKSDFVYRFRLGRKRILFVNRVHDSVPPPQPAAIAHTASAP